MNARDQMLEARIAALEAHMKDMSAQAEEDMRLAIEFGLGADADPNSTISAGALFDVNQTLDELLLLASTVISERIPDGQHRKIATDIARKVEKLDDWLSTGGQLPKTWGER